jgi:hypothetical protein
MGTASVVMISLLSWQSARWYSLKSETERMGTLLAELKSRQTLLTHEQDSLTRDIRNASARLAALATPKALIQLTNTSPRQFLWNTTNDYVCIPKNLLNWIAFDGTNATADASSHPADVEPVINKQTGHVSETLCQVMGLTPEEESAVQDLFEYSLIEFRKMCESSSYLTNATSLDFSRQEYFKPTPEAVAWVTPALPEEGRAWQNYLRESLIELIGEERAQYILRQAFNDNSISRCFNAFGAQESLVAATPMPNNKCYICRRKTLNGEIVSGLGFAANIKEILSAQDPNAPPPDWSVLKEPLPPALVTRIEQWQDTAQTTPHTEGQP